MRILMLRLVAIAGVVLTLGACADNPTQADRQRAPHLDEPGQDEQVAPQGCVIEGLCVLPPISGGWCDPYEELDGSCDEENCMTSEGEPTDPEGAIIVQSCPGGGDGDPDGGGTPPPPPGDDDPGDPICPTSDTGECPPEEEEYSDICPQPILGKVATALVPIAGRNHEFKFEGTFWRVNPLVGRSPAWYKIERPALSKDSWWMAESGSIQLVCWGRYVTVLGTRVWGGTVYVQNTELHVVMGPGHPDF
jgi:hypothetical protein